MRCFAHILGFSALLLQASPIFAQDRIARDRGADSWAIVKAIEANTVAVEENTKAVRANGETLAAILEKVEAIRGDVKSVDGNTVTIVDELRKLPRD